MKGAIAEARSGDEQKVVGLVDVGNSTYGERSHRKISDRTLTFNLAIVSIAQQNGAFAYQQRTLQDRRSHLNPGFNIASPVYFEQ